jgi:hypothetical protein
MLLTLILFGLAALGAAAVIYVAFLAISEVRDYLREKRTQEAIKEDAFILKQRLDTGKVRVVTGFLDGEDIKEARVWEAEEVDSSLENIADDEVVVIKS